MSYYVEIDGTVKSVREVESEIEANRKIEQEPEIDIYRDIFADGILIPGSRLVKCPYCNNLMNLNKYHKHKCSKRL